LIVRVKEVPFRLVEVADLKTINDDGMAVTVNVCAVDVPAPAVDTVTESVPTEAIFEVLMVVVACVAETNVVVSGEPFQLMVEGVV
jgi:hypothetical protein